MGKVKMRLTLLWLALLISTPTLAGSTKAGDGGHALACPKDRISLLDLQEAETQFGFRPFLEVFYSYRVTDRAEVSAAVKQRLADFAPESFIRDVVGTIDSIGHNVTFFSSPFRRIPTNDAGTIFTPVHLVGCEIFQIAVTKGELRSVYIDYVYFAMMEATDQGALLLHEALHHWFGSQPTSLAVRQAVWFITAPYEFRVRNRANFLTLINGKAPLPISSWIR